MKALLSCELLRADICKLELLYYVAKTRRDQEDCLLQVLLPAVANEVVSDCCWQC